RALLSYHRNPLVYRVDGELTPIVRDVLQADLIGGWGIGPVRVGLDVPVYLFTDGPVTDGEAGIGDIGLDGRVTIFGEDAPVDLPVDLGVQARLFLPTATVDTALGAPDLAGQIALVGSIDIDRVRLAANVGTRINPEEQLENVVLDDAFEYRLGGAVDLTDDVGVALELAGLVYYSTEVANRAGSPFEGLLSAYGNPTDTLTVRGGIGRGFTTGVGSPDLRIIAGLSLAPGGEAEEPVADTDGDGILDDADACPGEAEDVDEHEDEDGCPDPTTTVAVKVVNAKGKVVKRASIARRTPKMEDPERSRGGSQELDMRPAAWTFEASAPGYKPAEASLEVVNGPPMALEIALEPESDRIVVTGEQIELEETIQFQTGSARLLKDSLPLLDEIVGLLKKYPEIAELSIEGHTDNRGDAEANQKLSAARAATVEAYMVNSGIDAERLSSQGFGETKPLDDRDVDEAWEKNRRVEIRILKWSDDK
ncbi:MAG: OmpA family protein, partial [Myxococcota bacterium]